MLEIRRLRLLHELDRRGTIAAVAEALHFSPSGVSQQLAQLESETGVVLLERVGRRVRLTDAGRLLAAHADTVVRQLERAEAELAALEGRPAGTVRIAAFQTAALALVPRMLDRLAEHPGLRVEVAQVEPERALPALLARTFDLIVSEEYPGAPTPVSDLVDRVDLCSDELLLAVPDDRTTLADASRHAWTMEPAGTMSRQWATNACRAAGFEPDVRFETDDMLAQRELARRGHAVAFLPAMLLRAMPSELRTRTLGQSRSVFTLVRRGSETHPGILAVRSALSAATHDPATGKHT
ncbi:MAG: LysR family transcriptional regulator [Nocardioidaceae bacterium]